MKYIGNKTRLVDFILEQIKDSNIASLNNKKVLDLFAGTGSVSLAFKSLGAYVTSVDFLNCCIANMYFYNFFNTTLKFVEIPSQYKISTLNDLFNWLENKHDYVNYDNYYFDNYSPSGLYERRYFSDDNGHILDVILSNLNNISQFLSYEKMMFLKGCIMNAADRVSNTAGTYGAFLKIWRSMALKPLKLECPEFINGKQCKIVKSDVFDFLTHDEDSYDLVYIDPPYTKRQYASNFHVLENIVNNNQPVLKGKSGLIDYSKQISTFCSAKEAENDLRKLINLLKCNYIVLSYSTEGIIDKKHIFDILSSRGTTKVYSKKYRRFKTNEWTNADTNLCELLFICYVNNKRKLEDNHNDKRTKS